MSTMLVKFQRLLFFILLLSTSMFVEKVHGDLSSEIFKFAENMGAKELQLHLDELDKTSYRRLLANTYLQTFAETLQEKVQEATEKLQTLKKKIIHAYDEQPLKRFPNLCCNGKANAGDVVYETCDMIQTKTKSCDVQDKKSLLPDTDFFEKVYGGKIKKIYYGDEENGYYMQYPSKTKTCECSNYDPRVRPWYAGTVTPKEGKDVVIAVDFGENVVASVKKLLKNVASMLLKTIDSKDKVALLLFKDSKPFTLPDVTCTNHLVLASPSILFRLKNFIESENEFIGENKYTDMIKASFQILREESIPRKKVILFVTATPDPPDNDDNSILRTIIDQNKVKNHEVLIHIFTVTENEIHPRLGAKQESFAEQDCRGLYSECSNGTLFAKYKGKHVNFNTKNQRDDLRSHFGSLYSDLTDVKDSENVKFTLPHFDYFGFGKLVDACLPIYSINGTSKLLGVVCVSFQSSELLNVRFDTFKESADLYTFLIDDQGTTYIHPKYEEPTLHNETAYPVHIKKFETSHNFQPIYKSMISGQASQKTITVNASIPRGDVVGGSRWMEKEYLYTWKKIHHSPFSLAIVESTSYKKNRTILSMVEPMKSQLSLYHNFDLPKQSVCKGRLNGDIVTEKSSSLHFSPDSFNYPQTYYKDETKENIRELMKYFDGGKYPDGVGVDKLLQRDTASSLRMYVAATSQLDAFWKKISYVDVTDVYWRYVGLANGMFRTYPGHFSHPYYDPRRRPWYILAADSDEELVITSPYGDFSTDTSIVTIARKIYINNINGVKEFAGVMGLDFRPSWFKKKIEIEIDCGDLSKYTCMIVDKSGTLVYHPDFVKEQRGSIDYHITQKVPSLAAELISRRYMRKEYCIGYHKLKITDDVPEPHTQMFYKLHGITHTIRQTKESCLKDYEIAPINFTNLFLIKVQDICDPKPFCYCEFGKGNRNTTRICQANYLNRISTSCECPCYFFHPCTDLLPKTNTTMVCQPPDFRLLFNTPDLTKWQTQFDRCQLNDCGDPKCNLSRSIIDCNRNGCTWCRKSKDGRLLNQSYCSPENMCPSGTETIYQCNPSKTETEKSSDRTLYVAIIVAVLAVVIIVVAYFLKRFGFFRRIKYCFKEKKEFPSATQEWDKGLDNPHKEKEVDEYNTVEEHAA